MAIQIQLRRDTAANWTAANPVLAQGEVGIELDTDRMKIGDGATAWNSLPYVTNQINVSAGAASANLSRVVFSNSNGVSFGLNASTITASVVAAAGSLKFSAGTLSSLRTDLTFSNSNGVSFGLETNGVITATVQTNYITTAMASNRGSDFVQATAAFAGTNASGTINSTGISVSVAPPSAQSINVSAGTTSNNLTAVTFSNSNNVSFGINASTVTASIATTYAGTGFTSATTAGTAIVGTLNTSGLSLGVPAFLTTAMQSNAATISNVNISAGTTSTNASAFTFSNSNNFSFGLGTGASAGVVTASYTVPTVTNSSWTVSDAVTSATVGRLAFTNSNGLTLTLSTSNNGNHTVIGSYTVPSTAGLISAINVSAGTTSTNASAFTFSNANNVSFGLGTGASAGNITASIATTYAGTGFTTATTAGTAIVGTLNTSGLSLGVPAFLTTAMQSNAATISNINISAGTTSTNASAFTFSNGSGVSFGLGTGASAGNITASVKTDYAGTGTSATNASITLNTAGLAISVAAPGAASFNISAGTTSSNLTGVTFSNSNGITFGLGTGGSTGVVTASVATSLTNINISAGTTSTNASAYTFSNSNNISFGLGTGASAGVITGSIPNSSSLVGSGGISLSTNGSTITISESNLFHYEPLPLLQSGSTTWAPGIGTWHFAPFYLPAPISGGRLNIMVAHGSTASILHESTANFQTGSTGTGSTNFTYGRNLALYSLGGGTNSTRLESFWSNVFSLSIDYSIKVASAAGPNMTVSVGATVTHITSINSAGAYTTTTYGASSTTAGAVSSIGTTAVTTILTSARNLLSSQLMIPVGFNTTINPGLYWLAQMWSTASTTTGTGNLTSTGNVLSIVNQYGIYGNSNTAARIWGQTAATSGSQPFPGVGFFASTTTAPPATIAFSDIRTFANQVIPYFNFVNSTI